MVWYVLMFFIFMNDLNYITKLVLGSLNILIVTTYPIELHLHVLNLCANWSNLPF